MAGSFVVDVVKFTAASAGAGSFVVSGAVAGYQTPTTAGAVSGSQYSYRAESADLSQWEIGQGTFTSSNVTMTRTPLINSVAGTSTINFTAAPQVGFVALAEDLLVTAQVSPLTNSLAGDVALTNVSSYFDGPTVTQGTVGTWFASGTVTLNDTGGTASNFYGKLWDGTTVIDSANAVHGASANLRTTLSLSGFITSPSSNIKISVRNLESTTASIEANRTGNGKDSTLTVFRIR